MNILSLNGASFGSTGTIMIGIMDLAKASGNNVYIACPSSKKHNIKAKTELPSINFSNYLYQRFQLLLTRITGFDGSFCYISTLKLIKYIKKNNIDLIHIHNIHTGLINFKLFFSFIKKEGIRVVWTLHDCWAFTGHCPYFTLAKCDKWQNGCYECKIYKEYPISYLDNSKRQWIRKNKYFNFPSDMIIVTPSQWLANNVRLSFLKSYPLKVINNGIDLNVFKPVKSNFRLKYNILEKYIVLGVAFGFDYRKGVDVFVELSQLLPKIYKIVIVGSLGTGIKLPKSILHIPNTSNRLELAEIYSSADVFFNPTREENYPTVNMEALACGCPVVTFNTGGSPEIIDKKTGIVVPVDDVEASLKAIEDVCEKKKIKKGDCLEKAKSFDFHDRFQEYIDLYNELMSDKE